jgi:phage-related protein
MQYKLPRDEKPLRFIGSALKDLLKFPEMARHAAGHDLDLVQKGLMPADWKPMASIGPGAYEIRIKPGRGGENRQHRVLYVSKFEEAVYVLHAFEKKTRGTSPHDQEIGRVRYRQMLLERGRDSRTS